MVDEVLRLRTTVVSEGAVAGFRQAEEAARRFAKESARAFKQAESESRAFTQSFQSLRRELGSLAGMSNLIGAAGIGLAMRSMVTGTIEFSKSIVELNHASKELGMSERDIRAWGFAAERVGISSKTMVSNLQKFADISNGLRYNVGGVRNELIRLGAGPVVREMMKATDQAERLRIAFRFKDALMIDDPSGFKARMFFQQMGLGVESVRLSYDEWNKTQAKVRDRTDEEKKRAEVAQDAASNLAVTWERVSSKMAIHFFPLLNEDLQALERVIDWFGKLTEKWEAFRTRPVTPGGARGRTPSVYRPPDVEERGPGRTPSLRRRRSGTTGEIIGGETNEKVGGGAGNDVLAGSEDTLEHAEEEGTFKALVKFASYQHAAGGGGGGGGLGSGPAGGGGGGGGVGGQGGGGRQGGGGHVPAVGVGGEGMTSGRIGTGHEVDQYGGLTGKVLAEPISAVMGRGLGDQSGVHGRTGHQGVDLMAPVGTPTYSPQEGVITRVGRDSFGEQTITVKHPDGTYSRYLHQRGVSVKVGQNVKRGEQVGTSGHANVPHTHFEMWRGEPGARGSKAINPKSVFGWGKDRPAVGGRETTGRGPSSPSIGAPVDRADKEKGEMTRKELNDYMGGGGDDAARESGGILFGRTPRGPGQQAGRNLMDYMKRLRNVQYDPGSPTQNIGELREMRRGFEYVPSGRESEMVEVRLRPYKDLSTNELTTKLDGASPQEEHEMVQELILRRHALAGSWTRKHGRIPKWEPLDLDPGDPNAPLPTPTDPPATMIDPRTGDQMGLPDGMIDRANGGGRGASNLDIDVEHNGTAASVKTDRKGSDFAEPKMRPGIGAM